MSMFNKTTIEQILESGHHNFEKKTIAINSFNEGVDACIEAVNKNEVIDIDLSSLDGLNILPSKFVELLIPIHKMYREKLLSKLEQLKKPLS